MLLGELCSPVQLTWCSTVLIHIALLDCFTLHAFHMFKEVLILKRYSSRFEDEPMEEEGCCFFFFFWGRDCTLRITQSGKKCVFHDFCSWLVIVMPFNCEFNEVDFPPSEFCINSLPPESKAHTKLCVAHISLSYQYNTCVSEKYEYRFYFTQVSSSHLPSVCLYKSQSSSVESLISTQLHMLMLHTEGS